MRRLLSGGPTRATGLLVTGLMALGTGAPPALTYSFRDAGYRVIESREAPRWAANNRDIVFRPLENANGRFLSFWDPPDGDRTWQDSARLALQHWNSVRSADIRLTLSGEAVAGDWASASDGINTIGVSSYPPLVNLSWPPVINSTTIRNGEITGCDIELNPTGLEDIQYAAELEGWILHHAGHCLGLAHTEPFTTSLRSVPHLRYQSSRLPDPVMSDGWRRREITPDDIAGLSALYPTPEFTDAHGAVRGELLKEDGSPVMHAYVQTLTLSGEDATNGPGVFTNAEGRFLVEGVSPGPAILVIHPILRPNYYSFRPVDYDFRDQWRLVQVRAGEVVETRGPPIRAPRQTPP